MSRDKCGKGAWLTLNPILLGGKGKCDFVLLGYMLLLLLLMRGPVWWW